MIAENCVPLSDFRFHSCDSRALIFLSSANNCPFGIHRAIFLDFLFVESRYRLMNSG